MTIKKRTAQEGFTLQEVAIAVFVLFVFMAGAYNVVTQMMWLNQAARDHYVAANLSFNRLERIRNLTTLDPMLMAESQMVVSENGVPQDAGNFRRTTTVSRLGTNLVELICQVEIRNRKSLQFDGKQETLQTIINR